MSKTTNKPYCEVRALAVRLVLDKQGKGVIAGLFRHDRSRALDPQPRRRARRSNW